MTRARKSDNSSVPHVKNSLAPNIGSGKSGLKAVKNAIASKPGDAPLKVKNAIASCKHKY